MWPRYTKAPPPMVEVWTWDKFYVGLNGGYSWGRSDTSGTFYNNVTGVQLSPTQHTTLNLDGWVFGGQVGKNWQNGKWVFGLEADAPVDRREGQCSLYLRHAERLRLVTSVTRLPGDQALASPQRRPSIRRFPGLRRFVGGLAPSSRRPRSSMSPAASPLLVSRPMVSIGGFNAVQVPTSAAWSQDETRFGWVVGAGLEARLTGNWTGKIEGLYMDYGSVSGAASAHQQSAASVQLQFAHRRHSGSGRHRLPCRRHGVASLIFIDRPV